MQAAFVDVGLERTAFLHASDIATPDVDTHEHSSGLGAGNRMQNPQRNAVREPRQIPGIHALVRDGQEVLVQVIKDPIGSKGARLTTHLSIPSRYLVYMPESSMVGVSQRIEDEKERVRLREMVEILMREMACGDSRAVALGDNVTALEAHSSTDGFIVRTAAEGAGTDVIRGDMDFLKALWDSLQQRARTVNTPGIVHEDLPLVIRTLREMIGMEVEKVRIDSWETHRRVLSFTQQFIPDLVTRVEHYPGERPIFDLYGVEDEIHKALERKVQLKSGGHLIIDQTEAMTTIDVNTGAYVGHRNLEETIFKTNLEATQAIARQLRLRNLGGIIIIDFIDMTNDAHKRQVLRSLEKSLDRDHTKTHISDVSPLGLVQMTRKRTRESVEQVLCMTCPTCDGTGSVKTAETVCYEIFREILREARQFDTEKLLVLASREVVDLLLDDESTAFAELEAFIGKPITLQVETLYTQEQYDIVLM